MPIKKLTAANVKTLPAIAGRRTEYRDTVMPGLTLRVSPTGARVWLFTYNYAGRTHRYRMAKLAQLGVAQARAAARDLSVEVSQHRHPHRDRVLSRNREQLTVEQLADRYLEKVPLRPATLAEWRRLVRVEIAPKLGKIPAAELQRPDVRAWAEKIADRAPYVGNRAFEVLRRMYTWALERDLLVTTPFLGLKKPAEEKVGGRVLSTQELRALLVALRQVGGQQAEAVLLLLLTISRRGMVLGARRPELEGLDGKEPRWQIPGERMKSGRPHLVPLNPPAVALFKRRLQVTTGDVLFPPAWPRRAGARRAGEAAVYSQATIDRRWLNRCHLKAEEALRAELPKEKRAAATFPPWTLHSLRHTAATHLREDLGVAEDVVGALLAHARRGGGDATPIYLRAELLAERKAALEAWGSWLGNLTAHPPARQRPPLGRSTTARRGGTSAEVLAFRKRR